jgi:hypothetical protein
LEDASVAWTIHSREVVMKGGSLDPLVKPAYLLLKVEAAIADVEADLTKENLESTLRALIAKLKQEPGLDGVSVLLYRSVSHASGGNTALGRAEWWPRGHSFAPDNATNIQNKATYETTIDVWTVPETQTSAGVSRLSEATRREVFAALIRAQDRADHEAKLRHAVDESLLTQAPERYRQHVIDVTNAQYEESKKLTEQYESQVLEEFVITRAELDAIRIEALKEDWPLPRRQP